MAADAGGPGGTLIGRMGPCPELADKCPSWQPQACETVGAEVPQFHEARGSRVPRISDRTIFVSEHTVYNNPHPLIEALPELPEYIQLVRADALATLPVPMPRSQDLEQVAFAVPGTGDMVLAVSHAWPHQSHPDASGEKLDSVVRCCEEMGVELDRIFVFLDFLSVPQRPFALGQEARSLEEDHRFAGALQRMHWVYFYADRVMHLEALPPQVPEEGAPYQLPGHALRAAHLEDVCDWVQIVGVRPGAEGAGVGPGLWSLYDRVDRVDGQEVHSKAQVQRRMSLPEFGSCVVELQKFPFGRPNGVPASERGWVFLERFITMVKCSMLSPDSLDAVIICSPDSAVEQVREGAQRLRKAAYADHHRPPGVKPRALGVELQAFMSELRTKVFTSTSVDKAMNTVRVEAAPLGRAATNASTESVADVEIVLALMRLFIKQLEGRWDELEQTQQKRSSVIAAAFEIALHWEGFSGRYQFGLQQAAREFRISPAVALLVLPVASLAPYFLLQSRPDTSWRGVVDFWLILPYICYVTSLGIPLTVDDLVGLHRSGTTNWLRVWLWVASGGTVAWVTVLVTAAAFDMFPVPFTSVLATVACVALNFPFLYFVVPKSTLGDRQARMRLVYVLSAATGFAPIVWAYPVYASYFSGVGAYMQAAVLLLFFATRLIFEGVGAALARKVGPDVLPTILFLAMYAYRHQWCMLLLGIKHWLVLLELIVFDLLVKAYYIVELRRSQRRMPCTSFVRQGSSACSVTNSTLSSGRFAFSVGGRSERIATLLMLRQTTEVMVPIQFISVLVGMHFIRPDLFGLVDHMTTEGLAGRLKYLLVAQAWDICLFAVLTCHLGCQGFRPCATMLGLITVHVRAFIAVASTVLTIYVSLEVPHFGNDLTFSFPWLRDSGATWRSGTSWSERAQPPT